MFTIGAPEYKKKRSGVAEASPLLACGCFLSIFKPGSIIGVIEEKVSLFPKAIPHFGAKAFVDDTPHCAFHRCTQRLSLFFQHLHQQPILSLNDLCPMLRPCFDPCTLVGSQPVLPLVVMDGTDYPRKADMLQNRDSGNSKHQTGVFWCCPTALGPQVFVGKGSSPVSFDISISAGEIQSLSVQGERPI